jgi:hypothetical protein
MLFSWNLNSKASAIERASPKSIGNLRFISTKAMERRLDGSDERFAEYFFAIYHCSPDEPAGINDYREQLRQQYPEQATPVGKYFVLSGKPAYRALSAYYRGMQNATSLSDEFREYMGECLERVTEEHRTSQALSINLLEGQLANDPRLEFLTCVAIENGQVLLSSSD